MAAFNAYEARILGFGLLASADLVIIVRTERPLRRRRGKRQSAFWRPVRTSRLLRWRKTQIARDARAT